MCVERPFCGSQERVRECVEAHGCSVPGEFVIAIAQRGLEIAFEAAPHNRVQSISGDDEVIAGKLIHRRDRGLEMKLGADFESTSLQLHEEMQTADR